MHFPGHIRTVFINWIDADQPDTIDVGDEPETWPSAKLLGRLTHCSDILPWSACEALGIRRGSSYAAAAQRLLR